MWIEEQKNGKVKYCDRVKDISGKLRKITVTMDKKSKKNEDIAREILRTKAQDLRYVVDNNITFFEGLDIVFEKHYKNARTNTRHNNKSIINLIKKKGYDIKLNLINARYLKDVIEKCTTSDKYYNEVLKRVRVYIRLLYKFDYLKDVNFLDKMDLKKVEAKKDNRYLEQDEIDILLDQLDHNIRYRNLVEFLINTGLRISECLALTFDDVEGDILTIDKSLNRNREIDLTKTGSSNRRISLNKRCLEIIESQRTISNNFSITLSDFYNKNNIIFFNTVGTYWIKENVGRYLKEHTTVYFTLHMLRHTHASLCIDKGIDVELIAKRLGHKNSRVTREIYIHKTNLQQELEFESFRNIEF